MAKSPSKSASAKKPQAARAKAPAAVKATAAPKSASPSDAASGLAFSGEIEHVATPVPPLSSKAKARAKRAAKDAAKMTEPSQPASSRSTYPHANGGLFADAEAEEKATHAAKAPRKRQGATAAPSRSAVKSGERYVHGAKRALKTAKVSLSDVIDAIPPIPWAEWRQRAESGLGTTLVHAGKWLAERGFQLARQAEAESVSRQGGASAEVAAPDATASTLAEKNPGADQDEQRA
jgi:hypothetical protein